MQEQILVHIQEQEESVTKTLNLQPPGPNKRDTPHKLRVVNINKQDTPHKLRIVNIQVKGNYFVLTLE